MDFYVMNAAVFEPDSGPTFQFTPLTWAILLAMACKFSDCAAFGDDLNAGYLVDDLEVRAVSYYQRQA